MLLKFTNKENTFIGKEENYLKAQQWIGIARV